MVSTISDIHPLRKARNRNWWCVDLPEYMCPWGHSSLDKLLLMEEHIQWMFQQLEGANLLSLFMQSAFRPTSPQVAKQASSLLHLSLRCQHPSWHIFFYSRPLHPTSPSFWQPLHLSDFPFTGAAIMSKATKASMMLEKFMLLPDEAGLKDGRWCESCTWWSSTWNEAQTYLDIHTYICEAAFAELRGVVGGSYCRSDVIDVKQSNANEICVTWSLSDVITPWV